MAEDKVLGFTIDIKGVSNEAMELAKLELQLKNLKKERDELIKQSSKPGYMASKEQVAQIAAYNNEVKKMEEGLKSLKRTVDTASDSLARKKARLIELKQEYDAAGSAAARKMAPGINKLTDEIKRAEAAIGTHSRGVGNYKAALLDAGKQLIGFTSLAALAVAAVGKLKDMFEQTEQGAKFFGQQINAFKSFFQGIIGGEGLKESFKNAILAGSAAEKLNEIRKGDRIDLIEIAKLETDIALLRLKSTQAGLSQKEQLDALNEAQAKENILISYKIADKEEELRAVRKMLETRKEDTELLNKEAELEAEIIKIRGENSLRLATKISTLKEKEIEEEKKRVQAIKDAQDEEEKQIQEHHARIVKLYQDKWEQLVKQEKLGNSLAADIRALYGIKDKDLGLQENKKVTDANKKAIKASQDQEEKDFKESENRKRDYKLAALQGVEMGISAGFEARKSRLQAEMEAEMSQQNLTEAQKLDIRKKYAKEQQRIDVSQAIAAGALAILNALQTKPFIPAGLIAAALAAIQTGTQVAAVKAQKYAIGGRIQGGLQLHADTSRDNTLIYAKQNETVLTERHVSLLGGSGMMRRIGVPGYAMGGYIGSQAPEIPASGQDFNQMINAIKNIQITLDTNKVRSSLNEVEIINQTQRI